MPTYGQYLPYAVHKREEAHTVKKNSDKLLPGVLHVLAYEVWSEINEQSKSLIWYKLESLGENKCIRDSYSILCPTASEGDRLQSSVYPF